MTTTPATTMTHCPRCSARLFKELHGWLSCLMCGYERQEGRPLVIDGAEERLLPLEPLSAQQEEVLAIIEGLGERFGTSEVTKALGKPAAHILTSLYTRGLVEKEKTRMGNSWRLM